MKNIAIVSPECSKQSAQRLATLLKAKYIPALEFEQPYQGDFDTIINYGSSRPLGYFGYKTLINTPEAVKICTNKISTLKRLSPLCSTIEWTKDMELAHQWLISDGLVVARANETGSQGSGLTYCNSLESFTTAPAKFWTRYFHHVAEVRLNLYKGSVISIFDKQRKEDIDNRYIFDFVHLNINIGEQISDMISAITKTIGIDLCGVDILVNSNNECKLLEVNSGAIIHPQSEKTLAKLIKKDLE